MPTVSNDFQSRLGMTFFLRWPMTLNYWNAFSSYIGLGISLSVGRNLRSAAVDFVFHLSGDRVRYEYESVCVCVYLQRGESNRWVMGRAWDGSSHIEWPFAQLTQTITPTQKPKTQACCVWRLYTTTAWLMAKNNNTKRKVRRINLLMCYATLEWILSERILLFIITFSNWFVNLVTHRPRRGVRDCSIDRRAGGNNLWDYYLRVAALFPLEILDVRRRGLLI